MEKVIDLINARIVKLEKRAQEHTDPTLKKCANIRLYEARTILTEVADLLEKKDEYQVIVSNIGTVYSGNSINIAKRDFDEYVELSRADTGRAAGEDVTLMSDGEPELEYQGWLSMQANEVE